MTNEDVIQRVAEALAREMYSLDWDMDGFDHDYVRRLAEVAIEAAGNRGSTAP